MNRSLWPEGVEVHQVDLVRESTARATSLLQRFNDSTRSGIASGLDITVSSPATRLKVSSGHGYVPTGERIEITSAQDGILLADYTNGVKNYIVLVYTEVYGDPQTHETLGTVSNTSATEAYRLRVYTEAQFQALLPTDPNLNNDALDRLIVLAIVTAKGPAVNLTSGDVQLPLAQPPVFTVSSVPAITGATISSVASTINSGSGILTYIPGSPDSFTWQAPGDSGPGAVVQTPTDDTYTLQSGTPNQSIRLTVIVSSLPGGTVNATSTVSIQNLYSDEIPRFSSRDEEHRHLLGSGSPTRANPHGTTLADIVGSNDIGGVFQEHQDKFHTNGIIKTSAWGPSRSVLLSTVSHTPGLSDVIAVSPFGAGDEAVVNGLKITSIRSGTSPVIFTDITLGYLELWGIYCREDGTITKTTLPRVRINATGTGEGGGSPDPFSGSIQVVDVSDKFNDTPHLDLNIRYEYIAADPGNLWIEDPASAQYTPIKVKRPVTDSIVRLYHYDTTRYVDVWVRGSVWSLLSSQSVNIRIYPSPTLNTNMLIAYVVSHGTATAVLGYGQYAIQSVVTNNLVDRRVFGTTSVDNIRDDSLDIMTNETDRDHHANTYMGGFTLGAVASAQLPVNGGILYINGARYEVANQSVPANNGTAYIYASVDASNQVVLNVNASYAQAAALGTVLWSITVTAGVLTASRRLIRLGTKLEDKLSVTVDPDGINGMFTTLTDAMSYVLNAALSSSAEIVCKAGTYREPSQVYVNDNVTLRGDNNGSTIFQAPLNGATTVLMLGNNVKVSDLSIQNAQNTQTFTGIDVAGTSATIDNVNINCGTNATPLALNAIQITNTGAVVKLDKCTFSNYQNAIYSNTGANVIDIDIQRCTFTAGIKSDAAAWLVNPLNVSVDSSTFNWNSAVAGTYSRAGIRLQGVSQSAKITNNICNDNANLTATPETIFVASIASADLNNITITGNIVNNTRVLCDLTTDASHHIANVIVNDNIYKRSAQASFTTNLRAINIASTVALPATVLNYPTVGVVNVSIDNNKVINPPSRFTSVHGLVGSLSISDNDVRSEDSKCTMCAYVDTATTAANGLPSVTMTGNKVWNLQGTSGVGDHNYAFIVSMPGSPINNINISNNRVDNVGDTNGIVGANGYAVYIGGANGINLSNLNIVGNVITNVKNYGVYIDPLVVLSNSNITGNTVNGFTSYGIYQNGSMLTTNIVGNKFITANAGTAVSGMFIKDCTSCTVEQNLFNKIGATSNTLAVMTVQTATHTSINNNKFINCNGLYQIYVSTTLSQSEISNNNIVGPEKASIYILAAPSGSKINGNIINGVILGGATNTSTHGIYINAVGGTVTKTTINDNIITSIGAGFNTSGTYAPIYVNAAVIVFSEFNDNIIVDVLNTSGSTSGIYFGAPSFSRIKINGNKISNIAIKNGTTEMGVVHIDSTNPQSLHIENNEILAYSGLSTVPMYGIRSINSSSGGTSNTLIKNNHLSSSSDTGGIFVGGASGIFSSCVNVQVSGNLIELNYSSTTILREAVSIGSTVANVRTLHNAVNDNTIYMGTSTTAPVAILINGDAADTTDFSGNTMNNNRVSYANKRAATPSGLRYSHSGVGNTMIGNTCTRNINTGIEAAGSTGTMANTGSFYVLAGTATNILGLGLGTTSEMNIVSE